MFLEVKIIGDFVFHVKLNRPRQINALNDKIWFEIGDVFHRLDEDSECRVVILSGEGKGFCAGIDLKARSGMFSIDWTRIPSAECEIGDVFHRLDEDSECRVVILSGEGKGFCAGIDLKGGLNNLVTLEDGEDVARKARSVRRKILQMQDAFTEIERCCKPVVAAVHGVCLGAGIDIITACDIRHATTDAVFSVKEVDIGLAADVGTLSRLPKVCGNEGWVREVSLTARNFGAEEAHRYDLISGIHSSKEEMMKNVEVMARSIALKSPVAVQGTKVVLNYSRDHSVQEGLNFVATWNASQLLTEDIPASGMAAITKSPLPPFSKL